MFERVLNSVFVWLVGLCEFCVVFVHFLVFSVSVRVPSACIYVSTVCDIACRAFR